MIGFACLIWIGTKIGMPAFYYVVCGVGISAKLVSATISVLKEN